MLRTLRSLRLISAPSHTLLRSPGAIIPLLLLTFTLLLSACSSSANTPVGGSGSATPASGHTTTPSPNANTANCGQAPGFSAAGTASAGSVFPDIAFPANSVSVPGSAFTDVYTFTLINVCTNSTTAAAVQSFFASSLTGAGWSQSATYPYKGNVSSSCGDPYCWRKQIAADIRYVSLESVTTAGSVVVYTLRLAKAPNVTFNVATHSNTQSVPQGQTVMVTTSCASGEQMVGGGYFVSDTNLIYEAGESYPSSMSAWTSAIYNNTSQPMSLTTYVECVQANYPLYMQRFSKSASLSAGGSGPVYVTCPTGTVAVGGGAQSTDPGGKLGWAVTSSPGVDFTKDAWTVNIKAEFGALTETTWVMCASANAVSSSIAYGGIATVGASSSAEQTPTCASGAYATDGGFVDTGFGSEGDLFYYGVAPGTTATQWVNQVFNRDTTAAHNISTQTFCVISNPTF